MTLRAAISAAIFIAAGALSRADPAPIIHYAPAENLEHIVVELIESALREIESSCVALTRRGNASEPF